MTEDDIFISAKKLLSTVNATTKNSCKINDLTVVVFPLFSNGSQQNFLKVHFLRTDKQRLKLQRGVITNIYGHEHMLAAVLDMRILGSKAYLYD